MSGELLIVRDVLRFGIAASPFTVLAGLIARGPDGAWGAAFAIYLVLANTLAAGFVLAWASKRWPMLAPAAALPSYAVRMVAMTVAMAAVLRASFVDTPSFLVTFCVAVVATIFLEARAFSKTPWLALTFMSEGPEEVA